MSELAEKLARVAAELRRLAATHRYGGMPLVGLKGVDEDGALVSWPPRPEASGAGG